jgi:hypothetical protein
MTFLSVFIDHDATHTYTEKIVCCFVCGGKEKCGKTCEIFKKKQWQEFYNCENSLFFLSTSNLL